MNGKPSTLDMPRSSSGMEDLYQRAEKEMQKLRLSMLEQLLLGDGALDSIRSDIARFVALAAIAGMDIRREIDAIKLLVNLTKGQEGQGDDPGGQAINALMDRIGAKEDGQRGKK